MLADKIRRAHRRCCEAQEAGNLRAQLDQLRNLHELITANLPAGGGSAVAAHATDKWFTSKITSLQVELVERRREHERQEQLQQLQQQQQQEREEHQLQQAEEELQQQRQQQQQQQQQQPEDAGDSRSRPRDADASADAILAPPPSNRPRRTQSPVTLTPADADLEASGPLFSDWAGQQRRAVRFGDDDDLRQRGEHERGVSAEAAGDGTIDDDCGGEQIDGVPPPQETEWPQSSQMSAFGDGCSQSQGVLAYDEDYKCTICLEMLHEPLKSPVCDHRFCHVCFYSAVKSAGHSCPLCRAKISIEQSDPPIDHELWQFLQERYPERVRRRAARLRADQQVGAVSASVAGPSGAPQPGPPPPPSLALQRDRIYEEMRTHQGILERAAPDYFPLLRLELARPQGELVRCRCASKFVSIRRKAQSGREYWGCPLYNRNASGSGPSRGCNYFQWVV